MGNFIVRVTGVGPLLKMTVGEQNPTGKDIHYYKSILGIVTCSCCQKFLVLFKAGHSTVFLHWHDRYEIMKLQRNKNKYSLLHNFIC